ncbi:MAG: GxxExxY protein [Flavobacteriales bacterium]|nr:GxxExxY protein [Flavobacteriales bacterium]|tara:strand:+ start:299 stop:679 length:381 start_codon:yes stop_codon:yes gene_type:complete
MKLNELSGEIIKRAMKVHTALGPGLLESAYSRCLYYELMKTKLNIEKEVPQPVIYEEVKLDHGYRIDLLVERKIVLEIKSVEAITDVHEAQLLTYLKLGNYPLGLILNFHVKSMKFGIKRMINSTL